MQPLMKSAILATGLLTLASAQTINPNSVDIGTRTNWCNSQTAQCPLLCAQNQQGSQITAYNDCDPSTLNYRCVCNNNITPNASQYSLTIPYYECTTAADQCVSACANADNTCKDRCRTARPCGAQSPTRVNVTSTTSSSMSQPTSSAAGGLINGAGSSGSSAAAANMIELGRVYGTFVLLSMTFGGVVTLL